MELESLAYWCDTVHIWEYLMEYAVLQCNQIISVQKCLRSKSLSCYLINTTQTGC